VDAEAAMEILVFALFAEVKPKEKREKRRKLDHDEEEDSEDEDMVETVAPETEPMTTLDSNSLL
jgi:hypothetical protein